MSINASTLQSLVSISQFSKGQATQVIDRLHTEPQLIILKNNVPTAVLLSPDEFTRLSNIEEDYELLMLAQERLKNDNIKNAKSEADLLASLGITEDEISAAEDLEIE